jgi:hypothetical protein
LRKLETFGRLKAKDKRKELRAEAGTAMRSKTGRQSEKEDMPREKAKTEIKK